MFRTTGDRSNARAFENSGSGGVNAAETWTWAADPGSKLVRLAIVKVVTERANPGLILMTFLLKDGWRLPVGNFAVLDYTEK
jgi:hypothetical protein